MSRPRLQLRRRQAAPRALMLVAVCFGGSLALRLTEHGEAIAAEITGQGEEVAAAPAPVAGCTADPGANDLLAAIRDREAQLAARETELAGREQMLSIARAKLEEQVAALDDAEKRLAETLAIADKAAEQDVARLVSVYETMNPKAASQIFATMDVGFAAGFLSRMRPESAAAILAGIEADRAYAISATMAGRNARAPTQ
ncbi:MotE family protein [Oceanicella sp. SM1341]|uniref:MotE family protein n=1 Tax=Oceanicella sp. SM1341 TaxID=1548889 RepID=UPI000E46C807|nr:hypothetical protein [Oceanicella sp. SM1341]